MWQLITVSMVPFKLRGSGLNPLAYENNLVKMSPIEQNQPILGCQLELAEIATVHRQNN